MGGEAVQAAKFGGGAAGIANSDCASLQRLDNKQRRLVTAGASEAQRGVLPVGGARRRAARLTCPRGGAPGSPAAASRTWCSAS